MKYAIGIDIGGTKISIVIGDHKGRILAERTLPTLTGPRTRESVQNLCSELKEMTAEFGPRAKKIVGMGVGIPGPVDSKRGIVPHSPNLKGWKGIRLKKILESRFRVPVIMINDANAAAIGEKIFGLGRDVRDFIYMTVSTGIGGGIVVNNTLLEGKGFVAGEVGHMTIVPRGDLCRCGKQGCLEAFASGTSIAAYAKKELRKSKSSVLSRLLEDRPLSAKLVGRAAREGDRFAIEVYKRAGFYLGVGIANLLNILNPEKVILGGGVWKSAPPEFWNAMMKSCRTEAWPEAMKTVKILRSSLIGRVGDLGALALAFEQHSKKS